MAAATDTGSVPPPHPIHLVLLVSPLPLFLGALLGDWAYASTYQVQWTNFASWLIAGGLLFAALALLWALLRLLRSGVRRHRRAWLHAGLLLATVLLGVLNALVHARDAWAAMPEGFILSGLVLLLAMAALWTGFSGWREGR